MSKQVSKREGSQSCKFVTKVASHHLAVFFVRGKLMAPAHNRGEEIPCRHEPQWVGNTKAVSSGAEMARPLYSRMAQWMWTTWTRM